MILAKRLLHGDFKAIHGIESLEIWHIRGDGSLELAVYREEQMALPF
jgi:hypothetical protein